MTRSTTDHTGHRTPAGGVPVTAGVTLNARDGMQTQELLTREQVAYIAALAYASGTGEGALLTPSFAPLPMTPEQRYEQRLAEMAAGASREREWRAARLQISPPVPLVAEQPMGLMTHTRGGRRLPEPHKVPVGEPVDPDVAWPEVAAPGSGLPKW